nr:MAG TPA: DNA-directed RNA polymerase [Caudoviricetes sp.]
MAEYIERKALITKFKKMELGEHGLVERLFADGVYAVIAAFPAADVTPVVHGRWGIGRFNLETGNYEEQCTRCRNFSTEYSKPYCPNCGAKMDRGADHETN